MVDISIAGCLLAGGRSSRMGRDKRDELLGGKPLIAHAIDRLRRQVGALMISANDDDARNREYGVPVRPDPVAGYAGPLAGILTGLSWAAEISADALVTVPIDAPFFPLDFVERLASASGGNVVCAKSSGRLHPVFCLWRHPQEFIVSLDTALRTEGLRKVEDFVARYAPLIVEWPISGHDPFFNVNTPEDLAEAQRIAEHRA